MLGHHYNALSLLDLLVGAEKKILNDIMHFYNMTYGHALAQEPLLWRVGGMTLLTFHGHNYFALSLSESCPRVEKEILLKTQYIFII